MGAIRASKMPKGATITRKDNPGKVKMFAKGGKVKKADGGDVEFERTPADISSDITAPESSFKDAFRDARASGAKTFTWKGKSYTTALASDKAKAAAKPTTKSAAKPAVTASKPTPRAPDKGIDQMYKDMMSESRGRPRPPAPKPNPPKQPSSQVKGRAPAVGAAAKARRAEYDKEGYAKGGWISKAIKKPGALHEQLGVPKGKKIPAKKLAAAAKAPGKLGQRARFAETLKKMRKK